MLEMGDVEIEDEVKATMNGMLLAPDVGFEIVIELVLLHLLL